MTALFPQFIQWLVESGRKRSTAHVYSSRVKWLWKHAGSGDDVGARMQTAVQEAEARGVNMTGHFTAWRAFRAWAQAERGVDLWALDDSEMSLPLPLQALIARLLRTAQDGIISLSKADARATIATAAWDHISEHPCEPDMFTWRPYNPNKGATVGVSLDLPVDQTKALQEWGGSVLLFPRVRNGEVPLTPQQFAECRDRLKDDFIERHLTPPPMTPEAAEALLRRLAQETIERYAGSPEHAGMVEGLTLYLQAAPVAQTG